MAELEGLRIAILATDGFEESEMSSPLKALKKEGAKCEIIAPQEGKIQGFRHFDKTLTVEVDRVLEEVSAEDYDALHLPGGALNADALRVVQAAQRFVQAFDSFGKPMAAICHAPWLLVSAGLVKGKTLTSYHTIQDDIRNAGGHWVDEEVVESGNLITSRCPDDLPAYNKRMIEIFSRLARARKKAA